MGSKLNCKIGDLAIVVNTQLPENLGQIVEVLGLQKCGPLELIGRGHVWHVRTVSGRRTMFYKFVEPGRTEQHPEGPAPDCCLRPVSGLPDGNEVHEDVAQQKPVPRRRAIPRVAARVGEEAFS